MTTLHIRQDTLQEGHYPIRLTLKRADQPDIEAEAIIQFSLTEQEQEELRWYMEDYLMRPESVEAVQIEQIEQWMKRRGVELYECILEGSRDVQRLFDRVLDQLADLRVEVATGVTEAASIPWELMRDPQSDSAIALRVQSFVRVQSDPSMAFVACAFGRRRTRPPTLRRLPAAWPRRRGTAGGRQPSLAGLGRRPQPLRHHRPAPAHLRAASEGTH